jgi:hypothetical protein
MSFEELAAALEERLCFYKTVLEMMEKAVAAGDSEAIAAYSRLETRTAEEIVAHGECFAARKGESPRAAELSARIDAALEDSREASQRLQALLAREKDAVAAQLKTIRKSPRQENAPPPLVIDTEA